MRLYALTVILFLFSSKQFWAQSKPLGIMTYYQTEGYVSKELETYKYEQGNIKEYKKITFWSGRKTKADTAFQVDFTYNDDNDLIKKERLGEWHEYGSIKTFEYYKPGQLAYMKHRTSSPEDPWNTLYEIRYLYDVYDTLRTKLYCTYRNGYGVLKRINIDRIKFLYNGIGLVTDEITEIYSEDLDSLIGKTTFPISRLKHHYSNHGKRDSIVSYEARSFVDTNHFVGHVLVEYGDHGDTTYYYSKVHGRENKTERTYTYHPDGRRHEIHVHIEDNTPDYYELRYVMRYVYNEPVGINETVPQNVKIFPNPVNDRLFINVEDSPFELNYIIYGNDGKICLKGLLKKDDFIDVSTLNSGTYFMQIDLHNEMILERFIKN